MTLLNPAALGLLGLAIPLIALYILKLRRKDAVVPSTILWVQAMRDSAANAPFQKLRSNLLLLLQLLVLGLLALALARPALRVEASPGKVTVLVVDTSASMGARDGDGTRLDAAKAEARKVLEALGPYDEAMLVEAWSEARVASGLSSDRHVLRSALDALEVRDTPASLEEALRLAATAVEKREGAAVLLFSDGAAVAIPAHPVLEKGLVWKRAGAAAVNVGITAFRADPVLGGDGRVETRESGGTTRHAFSVFAGVLNASATARKSYVTLRANGEVAGVRAVELAPGESGGASFEVFAPDGAVLEASLDEPDALPSDDRAWTRAIASRDVKVAFEGECAFLRGYLRSRPRVQIVSADPDLWICEGPAREAPAGAHAVWFRPDKPVGGIVPGEPAERLRALSWDETHPLLRFARFADVHVSRAVRLSPPPDGVALVQGGAGPLIAATQVRGKWRIAIAFRAEESDWPLRPSFPVFFANVLRAVEAARAAEAPGQVACGKAARFAAGDAKEATVAGPDGRKHALTLSPAGDFVFADTLKAGLYSFESAAGSRLFGANLLSDVESNLSVPEKLGSEERGLQAASTGGPEDRDLWPWLAAAALALFLVEWFCWHRRVA